MRKKRPDIQVFSVSFLDVLSCALGAVLLLLLAYKDRTDVALADAQADAKAERQKRENLERAQAALVGLEGDMNDIVFVFDTSGSMEGDRFDEYKDMLKAWVQNLPKKSFNVIDFDDDVVKWRHNMAEANDENKKAASQWIDEFTADGSTHTWEALEAAFAIDPSVDTIVLLSDGRPSDQSTEFIEERLKQINASRGVTVNCVAMGDYFGKEYAEFLQRVARDHGGMFVGR